MLVAAAALAAAQRQLSPFALNWTLPVGEMNASSISVHPTTGELLLAGTRTAPAVGGGVIVAMDALGSTRPVVEGAAGAGVAEGTSALATWTLQPSGLEYHPATGLFVWSDSGNNRVSSVRHHAPIHRRPPPNASMTTTRYCCCCRCVSCRCRSATFPQKASPSRWQARARCRRR